MAIVKELLRMAARIERERIREIIRSHEDDDARIPGILVDKSLDEIGEDGDE